jgi:hypothetical protein
VGVDKGETTIMGIGYRGCRRTDSHRLTRTSVRIAAGLKPLSLGVVQPDS